MTDDPSLAEVEGCKYWCLVRGFCEGVDFDANTNTCYMLVQVIHDIPGVICQSIYLSDIDQGIGLFRNKKKHLWNLFILPYQYILPISPHLISIFYQSAHTLISSISTYKYQTAINHSLKISSQFLNYNSSQFWHFSCEPVFVTLV